MLLQELSFRDESFDFEGLEASFRGHKLVLNSSCPWDTAIVIHSRWKASLRWFASSCHSVWVGLRATEEFTFCSIHLPSWVDDNTSEKSIDESLDAVVVVPVARFSWGLMRTAMWTKFWIRGARR